MANRLNLRANRRGQTLAEFAIVIPILIFVIFAVIDFATVLYTYSEVAYAANAGARWASVRGSTYACGPCTPTGPAGSSDITTYVQNVAPFLNTGNQATVTSTWTAGSCQGGISNCPGSTVQVTVRYDFPLWVPGGWLTPLGIVGFKAITVPLGASTQMVISQ